ncbi:MAG TPA: LysE family translocator [Baekduia sp.]|nr:LysE family translocator [Baekduia sp.]
MPSADTLVAFALVAAAFVAIPGPSNLYVIARGLQSGPGAAVAGAAGCATGALTYVAATAAGLSALIASSQLVFAGLHYAGAAYLCWLGIAALRSPAAEAPRATGNGSLWRSYRQGALVELGNPKVALFFLALFPQFVHRGDGPTALQVVVLGAIFVALGFVSDSMYAMGSGRLSRWLARRPRRRRRQQRATGLLYLGLGGWAAASGGR